MRFFVRCAALATTAAVVLSATNAQAARLRARPAHSDAVAMQGKLPDGRSVAVYANGLAQVSDPKHGVFSYRPLPYDAIAALDDRDAARAKRSVLAALSRAPQGAYVPQRAIVVFRRGVAALQDVERIPRTVALARRGASLAPFPYTSDARLNTILAKLGVDSVERIGRRFSRTRLSMLASRAGTTLDLASIYRIHLTNADVEHAIRALARADDVALAEPDWTIVAMNTGLRATATPQQWQRAKAAQFAMRDAAWHRTHFTAGEAGASLPDNYGLTSSLQSYEDAPGVDSVAAYDEIERRFKQLPGTGEIVTDVTLGDLDDHSAFGNRNDPCYVDVQLYGATTTLLNGSRYLDLPSMPLIPTFVANAQSEASSSAEVCGIDPSDGEIDLDFSVMAPLPDPLQRAGSQGAGLDDMLGIAPGAQYRLVAPQTPANSDLLGALLAAAEQTPAPNVIVSTIGFGSDAVGFPGRYLEDDPLTQSVIRTIVEGLGIVVCISANDGLRMETNAPVNPSGGSTPTNLATASHGQSSLDDLYYSTAPSYDLDTGAIDVGGTTLDDIYSANPLRPQTSVAHANERAWPETRWNGFASFSSGYGTRVNISAPSDNIAAMEHYVWNFSTFGEVVVGLQGGTSASAPMVAAGAAVALQVARLTGKPLAKPAEVRSLLVSTARAVPAVPQADGGPSVGPQLSVRRVVETLLTKANEPLAPAVARVAVMQRRSVELSPATAFYEDVDPGNIDLQDVDAGYNQTTSDEGEYMPITIAPDWEFLPAGTTYRLFVTGHPAQRLSTQPYARLYPEQILRAAGLPLVSQSSRTVSLTYAAVRGFHTIVQTTVTLTFGPAGPTSEYVPAPLVAGTIAGSTMHVRYDFSKFPAAMLQSPALVVSYPGRFLPVGVSALGIAPPFKWSYAKPLTSRRGTVDVPVASLDGAGVYGVAVELNTSLGYYSDLAFTRLSAGNARPPAPLLTAVPAPPETGASHSLDLPYNGSFTVAYDVSKVPNATNALLEFSAAAPTLFGNDNTFNNPQGNVPDDNGADTGSVATIPLSSTRGRVTLTAARAKLVPALMHSVRVIPMNGTTAAGEASDASTIAEAGIESPDGGGFQAGFSVDPNGNDGIYTSNQSGADGQAITSFGIFDQKTGAAQTLLSGTVSSSSSSSSVADTYALPGVGILGGDTALLEYENPSMNSYGFETIANVGTYQTGSFLNPNVWTPPSLPSAYATITQAGSNASGTTTAFLVNDPSAPSATQEFYAFSADPTGSSATPVTNISSSLTSFYGPVAYGFDYDPSNSTAYATADDGFLNGCARTPSQFLSVAFGASGTTVTAQAAPGAGFAFGLAIDPKTQIAAIPSFCHVTPSQIDIANLGTNALTDVPLSPMGWPGANVAVDPVNGLFLVEQPIPDTIDVDDNAMSQIDVLNEAGTLQKTIAPFSFPIVLAGNHFFGVDGTTRRGFVFGPPPNVDSAVYDTLEPFSY